MTVLAASGLTVRFGGRAVLQSVDVVFEPGRVTALLGPNGAGKSTLLACLAGLRAPDDGVATLDGTEIVKLERRDRGRRIGLLPQSPDVHWDVDVTTLVELGRFPHSAGWGRSAADIAAVERAIAVTDVEVLRHRIVPTLSGGERSRVLLARVLAGEPAWLLADEPLASLDPAHQLDVLAVLKASAAAGAGVVVVLHDLNHALHVADDTVLLRDGRIVAAGAAAAVLTEARIAETYGVATEIGTARDGSRFVVALGRTPL